MSNWRGWVLVGWLLAGGGGMAGCARLSDTAENWSDRMLSDNLITTSHRAMDQLLDHPSVPVDRTVPVLVASFANVRNLALPAGLGTIIAEQMATRLTQQRYFAREVKLRQALLLAENGEFMLSREVREVSGAFQAQAVVTGVFAVGHKYVYVSARLIDADTQRILSAHDYRLPLTREIKKLLEEEDRY